MKWPAFSNWRRSSYDIRTWFCKTRCQKSEPGSLNVITFWFVVVRGIFYVLVNDCLIYFAWFFVSYQCNLRFSESFSRGVVSVSWWLFLQLLMKISITCGILWIFWWFLLNLVRTFFVIIIELLGGLSLNFFQVICSVFLYGWHRLQYFFCLLWAIFICSVSHRFFICTAVAFWSC